MRAPVIAMTSLLWLAAGVPASARAADLVVYGAGDSAAAIAQVASHSALPAASFRATTLAELARSRPPLVVGGTAHACTGKPSTNAEVRAAADTAAGDVAYMDYEQAATHAAAAAQALGCLSEPIDADVAAFVFVQRGLAAFYAGDPATARVAFAQANRLHPGLAWDERYGAAPKQVFDASLADVAGAAVHVKLAPNPARAGISVDGRRAAGETYVSPGEHVFQAVDGSATVRATIDSGAEASVFLPGALPADAVGWAADPAGRQDLSAAMAGLLGAGVTVYVVHGERTFRLVAGTPEGAEITPGAASSTASAATTGAATTAATTGAATTATTATNVSATVDTMTVNTDKIVVEDKHSIRALVIPGVILGGVGAVGGTYQFAEALKTKEQANQTFDTEAWNGLNKEYEGQRKATYAFGAVAAFGGLLAVSGVVFADAPVAIGPHGVLVSGRF